jgi:SPOR domain
MADNIFRSYRRRDQLTRGEADTAARESAGDPLAELARLIGQSDLNGEFAGNARQTEGFDDSAPAPEVDWAAADDGYAEQSHEAEERYAPPRLSASYRSDPADAASWPRDGEYENEVAAGGRYSDPAGAFDRAGEHARDNAMLHDVHDGDEQEPEVFRGQRLPAWPDGHHEADDQEHDGAQSYAADQYDDEAPRRRQRSGAVLIMAVLGLVVLGSAGAFGYRAMFGGLLLPSLPPIIKAAVGPNKIVPNHAVSEAGASSQAAATAEGSGEKLVSHQEQPVDIPPANSAPRVVSTIPVLSASPNLALPGSQPPAALGVVAAPSVVPAAAAPAPALAPTAPVPRPASPPAAAASAAPKKIHTVTIRPDQLGDANAAAAPPAHAARPAKTHQTAPRPSTHSALQTGSAGPLAIVPARDDAAWPPPPRTRTAMARPSTPTTPMPLTSAPVDTAPSAPSLRGGRYAVQVTSQRSEASAQAAFRSLQAKFPGQLGGHKPIIRRADLGAKGVYYRALVGPFASVEQAAGLCSRLKAAGGNCIIQRN